MRSGIVLLFAVLAVACDNGYGTTGPPPDDAPNVVSAVGVTAWSPPTITVKAGDVIKFRNATGVTHNVRFDQDVDGRPADVGNFSSGTKSVTFTTAGTFAYHCGIHPNMQGQVVVQP